MWCRRWRDGHNRLATRRLEITCRYRASLVGVSEFTFKMTDDNNGDLNPLGVNVSETSPYTKRRMGISHTRWR